MMKRLFFLTVLSTLMIVAGMVTLAQDDATSEPEATPERVVQLFSSSDSERGFNVPIPDAPGWIDLSEGDMAHFQNADLYADIYASAIAGTDADTEAGMTTLLGELVSGFDAEQPEPFATLPLTLNGTRWVQELYSLADGRDITAFGGQRAENIYVLIYVNSDPESDYYHLITQQSGEADLEAGVAEALAIFDPSLVDVTPDVEDTVTLSNGDWTRQVYDEANIHLIAQERAGNVTYIAIERGDGHLLDGINKQFLTVFLGFFLTPNNDQYLLLGVAAAVILMGGLIVSFFLRQRNLEKDLALIQQLRDED